MKNTLQRKLEKKEITQEEIDQYNLKVKDIQEKIHKLTTKRSQINKAQKDTTQIDQEIQNLMDERFDLNKQYLTLTQWNTSDTCFIREVYKPKLIRRIKTVIEPTLEMIELEKQIKELKCKAVRCQKKRIPEIPKYAILYKQYWEEIESLQNKYIQIQDDILKQQQQQQE
ncbi:Hypothetical_protein [Hexamita inflata]|uniref:Hypothetical_protein n=1 Tax=Hexamita inflata TaxID=28002 RepID=A0AA86QEB2_9EUKA|nr:Hypothetical protein HINF_LOCUS39084 [Hexamita inflata]